MTPEDKQAVASTPGIPAAAGKVGDAKPVTLIDHPFVQIAEAARQAVIIPLNGDRAKEVQAWKKYPNPKQLPKVRDAIDSGGFAASRWESRRKIDTYADSFSIIPEFSTDNPHSEICIAVCLALFDGAEVLGIMHCRKTWSNSLALDYLASHPKLLQGTKDKVVGVGSALLAYAVSGAISLDMDRMWAEVTQNSFEYYEHIFPTKCQGDILIVMPDQLRAFHKKYLEGQNTLQGGTK